MVAIARTAACTPHAACKLPRDHRMGFLRVRARGQRPPRQRRLGRGDGAGSAGLCGDGTGKMTYTAFYKMWVKQATTQHVCDGAQGEVGRGRNRRRCGTLCWCHRRLKQVRGSVAACTENKLLETS